MAIDRLLSYAEVLPELAAHGSAGLHEWEGGPAHEGEAEQFFGRLAGLAARAATSPTLRRVALAAARAALDSLASPDQELGGHHELELEAESELELEGEVSPLARVYPDVSGRGGLDPLARVYPEGLMEHLGHAAAEAPTLAESEAFIGALVPLAASLAPRIAPAVLRAAPALVRGVSGVARTLLRSPATRQLVRAVPGIVRAATRDLVRRSAAGRPVTAPAAVRAVARQTAGVIGTPARTVQVYRRSRALDRRFHAAGGVGWCDCACCRRARASRGACACNSCSCRPCACC